MNDAGLDEKTGPTVYKGKLAYRFEDGSVRELRFRKKKDCLECSCRGHIKPETPGPWINCSNCNGNGYTYEYC